MPWYKIHFYNMLNKHLNTHSNTVVPKLGAMAPPGGHGAIAGEPWAHIEKLFFSSIDTEIWTC